MVEDKNFLQTIKLEISRSFKLVPYERIAFHKVLAILKSDMGLNILLGELEKTPEIRRSAIASIVTFQKPNIVIPRLLPLLKKSISPAEKLHILAYVERFGDDSHIAGIIDFLNGEQAKPDASMVVAKGFEVLRKIGPGSDEVLNHVISLINSHEVRPEILSLAVYTLSSFKVISTFEELVKRNDDGINNAVFKAVYAMSSDITDSAAASMSDEERLFTYSPDSEDKIILDIRVFLGKTAPAFDSYSNRTKVSFIGAMMASNHREFLIYAMKALTSKDPELVTMALYALNVNITRLRDPDKLFRNLIALSTDTERDDELVIETFAKYFSTAQNSRQFNILKDKLFSYIVVTLETYFETFRKEFMITDVIEKGYPEAFQKVRKLILEKFSPDIKKEITNFLNEEEAGSLKQVITDLSRWVTHIDESEQEQLQIFYEILFDSDKKSRVNSAARLEDINFEKRYLRRRIIRLCTVIGRLNITDGASTLVNIYNYLKKYADPDLMEAAVHTLSTLNYSYMLGELEVMLTTGSEDEQRKALRLLSLFFEQRSLNIIMEFIHQHAEEGTDLILTAIQLLFERDIYSNVTAQKFLKAVIDRNKNQDVRRRAILCLGKCGFDPDINYLNDLFQSMATDGPKEEIVLAIGYIIALNKSYKRREVMKHLQEYLKDPAIKVRIYACLLLARLGNPDAMKLIRDMLVIKNKHIQRILLLVLAEQRSVEFCFFCLSLLREEYGITRDIIPVIALLPEADTREIDGFVVNIFQKYETPDIEEIDKVPGEITTFIKGLREEEVTVLRIDIRDERPVAERGSIPEFINVNNIIRDNLVTPVMDQHGIITRMSNEEMLVLFQEPARAADAALEINRRMISFNKTRRLTAHINVFMQIVTDTAGMVGEELFEFPEYAFHRMENLPLKNKIMFGPSFLRHAQKRYSVKKVPENAFTGFDSFAGSFELISSVNFMEVSNRILDRIVSEDEKKHQMQLQIADELKRMKRENRSTSSVQIAREMEDIGNKLKQQLNEIERYVQRRSTDRELINNVRKMLVNAYNLYKVEISRLIID